MKEVIVGVSGSRHHTDRAFIYRVLDSFHRQYEIVKIVHGAAPGADTIAEDWAKKNEIDYTGLPAKWKKEGKRAGPRRNLRVAEISDVLFGFPLPDSRGTYNAMDLADKLDKPVWICKDGKVERYAKTK